MAMTLPATHSCGRLVTPCRAALVALLQFLMVAAACANTPLQEAITRSGEAPMAQPEQTDYTNARLALKASYRVYFKGFLAVR